MEYTMRVFYAMGLVKRTVHPELSRLSDKAAGHIVAVNFVVEGFYSLIFGVGMEHCRRKAQGKLLGFRGNARGAVCKASPAGANQFFV